VEGSAKELGEEGAGSRYAVRNVRAVMVGENCISSADRCPSERVTGNEAYNPLSFSNDNAI
jgi:hypothetical protein